MPYFNEGHNSLLEFEVVQIANSPSNANSTRFPCSGVMSGDPQGLHHNYGDYQAYYTPWLNRRNCGRYMESGPEIINKPNPLRPVIQNAGRECRMEFETIPQAIAADAAIMMKAADDDEYLDVAVDSIEPEVWTTSPGLFPNDSRFGPGSYSVSLNKVMLPRSSQHLDGIIADCEMAHEGTEWDTLAQCSQVPVICKRNGLRSILWPNALNAPSQIDTRITENNAPALHAMFDVVLFVCGEDAVENFEAQLAILRGGARELPYYPEGIGIAMDVAGATEADALDIYHLMISRSLAMLLIWPNGSPMGGNTLDATNRKISLACFGAII